MRKPDIVGLAGPFTCQISNTIKVSKLVKEVNSKILTVVGGPHVTLVPKEFLDEAKERRCGCDWRRRIHDA